MSILALPFIVPRGKTGPRFRRRLGGFRGAGRANRRGAGVLDMVHPAPSQRQPPRTMPPAVKPRRLFPAPLFVTRTTYLSRRQERGRVAYDYQGVMSFVFKVSPTPAVLSRHFSLPLFA
jgi:hypothetical protein